MEMVSLPEESQNIRVVGAGVDLKFFTKFLTPKKLSITATRPLVSVALALAVFSMAEQALALEKAGNQGVQITNIQRCLQKIGYFRGPVTGKFGSLTKNAVIQFQQAHGLAADGFVGSRTEQLLQSECQSKAAGNSRVVGGELQLGTRGLAVSNLQRDLQKLGFFNGSITGYFGSETQQAVIRFQQSHGIRSAGVVGPKTTEAIRDSLNQLHRVSYDPVEPPSGIGGDSLPNGITSGSAGSEVVELQRSLKQLGYFNSNPTGYFGSSTRDAVIRFQQANGITANGIADFQTLGAITNALGNQNSYTSQNSSTSQDSYTSQDSSYISQNSYPVQNPDCSQQNHDICLGERSQRVEAVQQRLQQLGFFQGNVSGHYGPKTRDAIIQFQQFRGLAATGVVNYQTWQALNINNYNTTGTGNRTSKRSYVVVVPIHQHDTLSQVRQYAPEAFTAESRLGAYVNAGQFNDRLDAEKLSDALRSHGLDARVEFL